MTRVALILNPASRRVRAAVHGLRSVSAATGGEPPLVLETTVDDPGPSQARYAVSQGVERVVVAGGDGTVRLVAGELAAAAPRVSLGVLPIGTANLFARSARLPVRDLRAASRMALTAPGRPTDLGLAALVHEHGERSEQPFLVVAGVGQDAATLAAVRPGDKARARWLAYLAPGLRRLRSRGHQLTVTRDGAALDPGRLWCVLAVNAARLPTRAQVVPGAELDDGLLHAVLVSPTGLRSWARIARTGYAPARTAYPRDHHALRYRSAHTLVVEAAQPVPCQVDGDVVADIVRAQITLWPGALDVAR